jgi:hypothetical protein
MAIGKFAVLNICAVLALPFGAAADDAVRAKIGTLGIGIEYRHGLTDHVALRLVANGATTDGEFTDDDVDYDYEFKRRSAGLLFDWHPTGGKFFTTAGLLYNKNKVEASLSGNGSVTIGNTVYNNVEVSGDMEFKAVAPYLGVGWVWAPSSKGLSMALEVGVLYQGDADVELRSSTVSSADLRQEELDLKDEFKYYPNLSFAIGYRF